MKAQTNPRQLALNALKKCDRSGQYSNIALDNALQASGLSESDKRLAAVLFYGVIEKKLTLDYYISRLSNIPMDKLDDEAVYALRLGLYQLIYLDRVPDHAAINETVSLCTRKVRGFVNALLREYTRSGVSIELGAASDDPVHSLSLKYSVCRELVEKLCDIYGAERAESIISAFSYNGATTLRANTLKISRDELCELVGGKRGELSPYSVMVRGNISELEGYNEGLFYVQDEASQICAAALGAVAGDTVIDTCSCPGSKSFGIALDMKNEGRLYSFDLHKNKLSLVESSAKRLGIDIISTEARDARNPSEALFGKADRVLCDVPCSGFGVLGKKPELRYKSPKMSEGLPDIQYSILENSAKYLKKGGTLVYSTCTIFPEENERNIERFLHEHKEFRLQPFSVGGVNCLLGMLTLLPDTYKTDGFFIAKLTYFS